jgi:phosphoribosylanthranilate isomerase
MAEVRSKICGLTRVEDARAAEEAGADYVGVVLAQGFSRSIDLERAAAIGAAVELPLVTVRVDDPLDVVAGDADVVGAGVIQLHGREAPGFVRALRQLGEWRLWKSVRVRSVSDVKAAVEAYGNVADGILLDGWHPERVGGTGRAFSWPAVARVRECVAAELELIAAGGLRPDTVAAAVRILRPDIVDVSSGVESEVGVKDHDKIRTFVQAVTAE